MSQAPDQTLSRTERRKHKTRAQMLDATIDLLLSKGYDAMMMEDITDAADVGRRTFYNHFDNKRDCVVEAAKIRFIRYAEESEQFLQAEPDRDEALAVALMATRVFTDIAQDPITASLMQYPQMLNEAIAESQRDFITANIARGLVANRLRPALPVESLEPIIAWAFLGLVITSIGRNSQAEDSQAWAHFVLQNLGLDETEIPAILDQVSEAL